MESVNSTIRFNKENLKSLITNILFSVELAYYKFTLNENNHLLKIYNSIHAVPYAHKQLESYLLNIIKSIQNETIDSQLYCLIQSTVNNFNRKNEENRSKFIEDKNLINVITNISSQLYQKLPRSKLSITNEEEMIKSLNEVFNLMDKYMDYLIENSTADVIKKMIEIEVVDEIESKA